MTSIFIFISGATLLVYSAERLIGSLIGISRGLAISVFLLAIIFTGIEFDDIVLGIALNLEDDQDVALGLVIGTAVSFSGVVLALGAILTPDHVQRPARVHRRLRARAAHPARLRSAQGGHDRRRRDPGPPVRPVDRVRRGQGEPAGDADLPQPRGRRRVRGRRGRGGGPQRRRDAREAASTMSPVQPAGPLVGLDQPRPGDRGDLRHHHRRRDSQRGHRPDPRPLRHRGHGVRRHDRHRGADHRGSLPHRAADPARACPRSASAT